MWYVYILRCSDGSYYVGHTSNLNERVKRHNDGRGSSHTVARLPAKLIWYEGYETEEGIQREKQIKKWNRAKKQALIENNIKELKRLSKRITGL